MGKGVLFVMITPSHIWSILMEKTQNKTSTTKKTQSHNKTKTKQKPHKYLQAAPNFKVSSLVLLETNISKGQCLHPNPALFGAFAIC